MFSLPRLSSPFYNLLSVFFFLLLTFSSSCFISTFLYFQLGYSFPSRHSFVAMHYYFHVFRPSQSCNSFSCLIFFLLSFSVFLLIFPSPFIIFYWPSFSHPPSRPFSFLSASVSFVFSPNSLICVLFHRNPFYRSVIKFASSPRYCHSLGLTVEYTSIVRQRRLSPPPLSLFSGCWILNRAPPLRGPRCLLILIAVEFVRFRLCRS